MVSPLKLPLAHLTARVPWHDRGWDGHTCNAPAGNTYCTVLKRIGPTKGDAAEEARAGQSWEGAAPWLPPCAAERAGFMAPFTYTRFVEHPYASSVDAFRHFCGTHLRHPAHSVAAVPFAWMLKEGDGGGRSAIAERLLLNFRPEIEPSVSRSGSDTWIQHGDNQRLMLDTFFSAVRPEEALLFLYAKRTPLTDDPRRVIVAMGRVTGLGDAVQHRHAPGTPAGAMPNWLWERTVEHSIRSSGEDGFVLPYHQLVERAREDDSLDLAQFALHPPDGLWDSFSMGSEHLSHDGAVATLIEAAAVVTRIEAVLDRWDAGAARRWIDRELNRLWSLRGAFPGLGSALAAMGVPHGTLAAYAVSAKVAAQGATADPWPVVDRALCDPTSVLPPELARQIGSTTRKVWATMPPVRRAVLQLLARFAVTEEQARRWFDEAARRAAGVTASDEQLLANPYLLFEGDRAREDSIPVDVVDRGLFPPQAVLAAHPVPEPSACAEPTDARRVRALAVSVLDAAAAGEGHTLLPQEALGVRIGAMPLRPAPVLTEDIFRAVSPDLEPIVRPVQLPGGVPAWQLDELQETRRIISDRVTRRMRGQPLPGTEDWRALVDAAIGVAAPESDPSPRAARDRLARAEKAEALAAIHAARFTAIIGPAGTGKTTLLKALLLARDVRDGGVLLLAPTGKARVQLQRKAATDGGDSLAQAKTIAQFLLASGRYNGRTGAYRVTGDAGSREGGYRTVVIDEASMLTEKQLAATLDAIETGKIARLVLVGDPRQLPPIGAGRPFVDVIRHLRAQSPKSKAAAVVELRTVMRDNNGDARQLASWFSDEPPPHDAETIWERLRAGTASGIKAVRWEGEDGLLAEIEAHVVEEARRRAADRFRSLEAAGVARIRMPETDDDCIETSLGGLPHENGAVYFQRCRDEGDVRGAALCAEAWQILSPVRGGQTGVDGLNRRIQERFKRRAREWASPPPAKWYTRRTAAPLGPQGILYGDKVINVVNDRRYDYWPKADRAGYLANGEIGIAVGQQKVKRTDPMPWKAEVEFRDQPAIKYGFSERDFGDDGTSPLELAYALTIHKAQGSEFGTTFVVVPAASRLLSRELLYTALTRHTDRIVLLHQGDLGDLYKLSREARSATAGRITNLLDVPQLTFDPDPKRGGFFESGLIHRTKTGLRVRSRGELIVANLLDDLQLPYTYEAELRAPDGSLRRPDFVVDDQETGRLLVVEHLGMMHDPIYAEGWGRELEWYRAAGILPHEEGGGATGTLVISDDRDGFDEMSLRDRILDALGMR